MKLHEYQAKDIFSKYGIPIPKGKVVTTSSQAATATFDIGEPVVVKAQVHAGGRGKAGGVRLRTILKNYVKVIKKIIDRL